MHGRFSIIGGPHDRAAPLSLRLCLLVPRSGTALAQSRSFASIGPTLWNALSPSVRSTFLSVSLSSSFASLKIYFISRGPLQQCTLAALLNGSPHSKLYTNV